MDHRRERMLGVATAASVFIVLGGNAYADELSFHFELSNGTQSASADFTFSDAGTLNIALTNTMTTNGGPNWLTGLFFNLAGSPTLGYQSTDGDMITLGGTTQTPYTDALPGNFWAYRGDLSGELPFGDQQYGLGAVGLDIFGFADILQPFGLGPLPQPDGTDGGILADIVGLEVPEGHEGVPFVLGFLEFVFELPVGFDLSQAGVSDPAFLFGTGFEETILLIPLPLPVAMAGAGLMIVVCFRRRLVALAGR